MGRRHWIPSFVALISSTLVLSITYDNPTAFFVPSPFSSNRWMQAIKTSNAGRRLVMKITDKFTEPLLERMDKSYIKKSIFQPSRYGVDPSKPDAIMVFFPGIGLPPAKYEGITQAIQKACYEDYSLNLYVIIAKLSSNIGYIPKEPERRVKSLLKELATIKNVTSPQIAVVGHSGGAFLSYDAALTLSTVFVHLGSTLNSDGVLPWTPRSILEYPKPLLTLLGEMDGYIRFTGGALEYAKIDALMKKPGHEEEQVRKPVVVLPGVSHEQFGDGSQSKLAKMSGRRDLSPYVPLQEAWENSACVIAAFFDTHFSKSPSPASKETLKKAVDFTGTFCKRYLDLISPTSEEQFVRDVQTAVANVEGLDPSKISHTVYRSKPEFIYSKPSLNTKGYVDVQTFKDQKETIKMGFTKQVSPALWLKMKRQEAFVKTLGLTPKGPSPTAQQLNQLTFDRALALVMPVERQRYIDYGRKLVFLPDEDITMEKGGGPGWINMPMKLEFAQGDPNTIKVTSPVLYSPVDTLPRFAGMCYMKVLTPAQALEWILHDAFVRPA